MMSAVFSKPENLAEHVVNTLKLECPEIPSEVYVGKNYSYSELNLDHITVDKELIANHNLEPLHINRRDIFIKMINDQKSIMPLIVLAPKNFLIDGYARYRALKHIGIHIAEVILIS